MSKSTMTLRLFKLLALLIFCTWSVLSAADVISNATLGNLTGPVDTRFMPDHHLYDVVWGNEKFVAVGNGAFDETEVLLSTNGLNWERVSLGKPLRPLGLSTDSAGTLYGVTWNGSIFVAVGERILTSSDGKSWTVTAAFATCVFSRVIAQGGMFVAVGGDRGRGCIATSADGRVWTERTSGIEGNTGVLSGVTWNGSAFVAIGVADLGRLGVSSVFLSSFNGATWSRQLGPADFLVDLAWGSGLFVAVGGASHQGALFTSPDLKEWTDRTLPQRQPLRGVLWNGSTFVTVGVGGTILTSTDGTTWSERKSGTDHDLLGVAYNGSLFVVVGDGAILTSQGGEQWSTSGGNWIGNRQKRMNITPRDRPRDSEHPDHIRALGVNEIVMKTEHSADFIEESWLLTSRGSRHIRSPLWCFKNADNQFLYFCPKTSSISHYQGKMAS